MKFKNPFKSDPLLKVAEQLYVKIVEQSRQPEFYTDFKTPDTVDGRFEMISVHAFLAMRRLKSGDNSASELSQLLFNVMFDDMDRNLREMGVGDLGVGKRVKIMAKVFYGRIVAYEEALDANDEVLKEALIRNHYGTLEAIDDDSVALLAQYISKNSKILEQQSIDDFMQGQIRFEIN